MNNEVRSSGKSDDRLTIRAHGKLLLTAEYFVLDGALALALPTCRGQTMDVAPDPSRDRRLHWRSFDHERAVWFEAVFSPDDFRCDYVSDEAVAGRLIQLFRSVEMQRPAFWQVFTGARVETRLDFPREWGLGTSSTLVAALARWTQTDPFQLLADTFGGSGYDLACAFAEGPILYQRKEGKGQFVDFPFRPSFADQLFFVYLGQKQNSREGIRRYREKAVAGRAPVAEATELTGQLLRANTLTEFEAVLLEHERLVAEILDLPRVQEQYFPDYPGLVKSLGAWGGDFVLATGRGEAAGVKEYFRAKGYPVVLSFEELIL